jgi:hypothetical protein
MLRQRWYFILNFYHLALYASDYWRNTMLFAADLLGWIRDLNFAYRCFRLYPVVKCAFRIDRIMIV